MTHSIKDAKLWQQHKYGICHNLTNINGAIYSAQQRASTQAVLQQCPSYPNLTSNTGKVKTVSPNFSNCQGQMIIGVHAGTSDLVGSNLRTKYCRPSNQYCCHLLGALYFSLKFRTRVIKQGYLDREHDTIALALCMPTVSIPGLSGARAICITGFGVHWICISV